MTENINIFYDTILSVPIVTFFVAVFLKWIILKLISWKFSLDKALWSGGMPSVHSAIVVSLATAIALKYWVSSDYFALAMTFTVIIIYDAINIRFEAWLHAWAINERLWEKKYKESLWHLPSEAFAWSVLWIVVSVILYYI
jgi:uncharacterized protein